MISVDQARERVRLLAELLELTPDGNDPISPDSLRRLLDRRGRLLRQLSPVPLPSDDPALAPLVEESHRLIRAILERDQAMTLALERARGRLARLMRQAGTRSRPPGLVSFTC